MATQSPFSLLEGLLQGTPFADLPPPLWLVDEVQRRIVLLLNHILLQEPQATSRVARQQGRVVLLQWRSLSMRLLATPAGLLDLAAPETPADLVLAVSQESPVALAQDLLRGERPAVRIVGDVQLAAEVNWLVDHVRWDIEEDLARVLGDAQAHTLGQAARGMASALRQFMGGASATGGKKASL